MKTAWASFVCGGLVLSIAGCGMFGDSEKSPTPVPGGVAVIDLDKIAKELKRDATIVSSIKQQTDSLNRQLAQIQNSLAGQIKQKEQSLSVDPTEAESQEIVGLRRQAETNLNQARQQAKTALSQHSQKVLTEFREEVKPVARTVASEKGLSVVVTKNDTVVFAFAEAVDITDEVVSRMRKTAEASSPVGTASAGNPNSETTTR